VLRWLLRIWIRLPRRLRYVYLRLRYAHFAVGVAALIRDEQGRILLVHRTYSHEEPWALPGGWLEGLDRPERTLERELLEETALHIRAGPVLAVERAGFAVVVLLAAELVDGSSLGGFQPSAEVNACTWAEPAAVSRLSRTNAALLRKAGLAPLQAGGSDDGRPWPSAPA
jgi:ADP-ribose pyrophosphatase YjhB (NUDIX family)